MPRIQSCYCHAIQQENPLKRLKILEVHRLEKTEKPLQILHFLRFSELKVKPAFMFPELALEWNYDKNGNITPEQLSAHSSLSVWWKCRECGHEWKANINARARGNGCKKCANAKLGDKIAAVKLANNGSLLDHHPQLAEEWNYARNGTITPETITAHNNQKVWWVLEVF